MSNVVEAPQTEVAVEGPLFRDLPLSEEVQLAVQMSGYITPTDIQAEIVPHMLAGRDVLAQSQTGTGKTAAFALPILSTLDLDGGKPQVLVLAPTRELATQVADSFETYGNFIPKLKVAAIYGGADYEPQLRLLKKGVHIVVGTPGRVLDHIRRGTLKLDGIRCLVLDEADEMLNMGFIDDVEFVLRETPAVKQVALFSATLPAPIRKIADQHLKDPASITIKRKTLTADSIEQRCVFVEEREKLELLSRLIELEKTDGVIVFTKTKDSTVHVADHLVRIGLRAAALNGDLPQARRQRTVDQLKSGQLDIIVATDVAARGLDVQRISHVFNYDLPHDGESYVHRIGRTGRAGRAGVAVIFLTHRQRGKLRLIENLTKKPIQILDAPSAEEINQARIERFKEQITASSTHADISLFQKVITDHAAATGQPIELIAASLAHMAQGGRPLLAKDQPQPRRSSERFDNDRDGRRTRSRDGGESRGRPAPGRALGRPQPGMSRFWIGVGRSDGVRPNNIVGAVANEAGISGGDIGPINIRDEFSTIDLPSGLPREALETLEKTWVSGKQLRIRPYSERGGERDSDRPERQKEFRPREASRGKEGFKPKRPASRVAPSGGRPATRGSTASGAPAKRFSKESSDAAPAANKSRQKSFSFDFGDTDGGKAGKKRKKPGKPFAGKSHVAKAATKTAGKKPKSK